MCSSAKNGVGVLQHFQDNPCCKHIVLGSCHDNGYVCHLDVIGCDSSLRDRLTLLQSFQTGRQYRDLPFKTIHLPSLFRTQAFAAPAPNNGTGDRTTLISTGLSNAGRVDALDGSTVDCGLSLPTKSTKPGVILVNAKGERLDRFIKKPSQVAFNNYSDKKKELEATGKRGPCNLYYLGGGCTVAASICQYWHEGFDKADVTVLRWIMRLQRCDSKVQCKSALCVYGHACISCHLRCKFSPEMHGVNRIGEREVPGE
jgi:hypothetical protein